MTSTTSIRFEGREWRLVHPDEMGGEAAESLLLVSVDRGDGQQRIVLSLSTEGVKRLDAPAGFSTEEGPIPPGFEQEVDEEARVQMATRIPDISSEADPKVVSN